MGHKGHYGEYSGNAKHSRKTNTWEEEDVKRGRREEREGHTGHAEALFDDAHGSYNWDGSNSTGAEHGTSRRSSSPLNTEGHGGASGHTHRLKPDYSDYEAQQKRHSYQEPEPVDERSGNVFPGAKDGQRDATTFLPSHPNYISKEDWANATDEQKGISRRSRSERLRDRARKRSERVGAEWGDYDYEDKRVQKMLSKASELDERSGKELKMTMTKTLRQKPKKKV